jgi:hypothetical protein
MLGRTPAAPSKERKGRRMEGEGGKGGREGGREHLLVLDHAARHQHRQHELQPRDPAVDLA